MLSHFSPISQQALSTRCWSISKSLIGSEYTKALKFYHSQESRGSFRPVDWVPTLYLLSTAVLAQMLCENVKKMRWCPIMRLQHLLSLMKGNIVKTSINTTSVPIMELSQSLLNGYREGFPLATIAWSNTSNNKADNEWRYNFTPTFAVVAWRSKSLPLPGYTY
jgi:hypothetical protein